MSLKKLFAAATLLLAPALAFAHPGHGDNGWWPVSATHSAASTTC